jgi:hypothetical protein
MDRQFRPIRPFQPHKITETGKPALADHPNYTRLIPNDPPAFLHSLDPTRTFRAPRWRFHDGLIDPANEVHVFR